MRQRAEAARLFAPALGRNPARIIDQTGPVCRSQAACHADMKKMPEDATREAMTQRPQPLENHLYDEHVPNRILRIFTNRTHDLLLQFLKISVYF